MPASWKLELHGLIEAQRAALATLRDLSGEPMVRAMQGSVMLVTGTARHEAKVDTGRWRASIVPTVESYGNSIIGVVGSNLAYGPYADLDTKPHWPPLAPLVAWVHRKRLAGVYSTKTRRRLRSKVVQNAEDVQVAKAIQRKIARFGTKGDHAIEKGVDQNVPKIQRLFERAVDLACESWGASK